MGDERSGPATSRSAWSDRDRVTARHGQLLAELVGAGDWLDGASRRAIIGQARAALERGPCGRDGDREGSSDLSGAAAEVVERVVNESGQLDRTWADAQIAQLGDAVYAEIVGVTATAAAIDITARSIGAAPPTLPDAADGRPACERPTDVGDVGAWIPMTEQKLLANVSRALSLVPRTNATWRALVTDSYSRGPQMLDLTWQRALNRPQIELIASEVSRLQECFY